MERLKACLFFLTLLVAPQLTFAASDIIRAIDYEGNVRTADESISSTISSKVGTLYDREAVRRDIKELYKLGQFQDIQVEREEQREGIRLIYRFVENPIITSFDFVGNRKIKDDGLEDEVDIRTYRPLDEGDVAKSIEKIRALYAKKGYYLADIDYRLEADDKGDTKLVFEIAENQGVSVRRLLFQGNEHFSDDALREVIRTKQKGPFSFITSSGKFDEEKIRLDKMLLAFHYLNHGYLKVKISPPKVTISKDKRYLFISFQIDEGEQYRIGTVDIEGDILTTKAELLSILQTKSGNLYHQQKLEEDVQALTERYGDEGYAFANIIPQTDAHDEERTADIVFRIEKGKRITIERINIYGNTTTRDKVIRRELKIVENDRYSERNIKESRRRLMQLGYFEEVNFATPRGKNDDAVELNITVKERPTGSFNIGAGFSTVESFIFNASIQKENLFGYGLSATAALELSNRRQFFTLSGRDPHFLDTDWSVGLNLFRNSYLFNDFRRTSFGGGTNLGHRFFDDKWEAELGYQAEDVSVSEFSFAVPQIFRQNANGLTSAFSLGVSRDTRNNRLIPTKGTFNGVVAEISGDKLGGDNDFFRMNGRSQFYQPIWKGIVFKTFGRAGYIKSLNDSSVPLFERFFMGGPNSLRGFFPQSIGPRLRIPSTAAGGDVEFVYGGDKLLLFVAELELPIIEAAGIKAVAFFDAGNAFAEDEDYSFNSLRSDYGFGLRWNSPMGPLRFEWGIPINQRPNEDPVVFNFTIGNFF